jgi:PAP2 superfamily
MTLEVTDTRGSVRGRYPLVGVMAGAAREALLVAAIFMLYRMVRALVRGEEIGAVHHAVLVRQWESMLHLPSEATVQGLVGSDTVLHAMNLYYCSVHFPLTIAFLLWGFWLRPRVEYVWARNLLVLVTGAALVGHVTFPLAPPRLFPQWGFTDTMATIGPSAYDGASGGMANQIAAMPSLHVGWALVIAYVVWRTGPRWLAALAVLHVVVTTAVVVVTANHWWLDGIVAGLLVLAAAQVLRPWAPPKRPQRRVVSVAEGGAGAIVGLLSPRRPPR